MTPKLTTPSSSLAVADAARIKKIFADPASFATTLVILFLDQYGTEALNWAPETIEMELREDFVEVPAANFDRLLTAISVLTTDSFYVSPVDFVKVCLCFSGHFISANQFALPDSEEVAWGVTEGVLLNPPEDDNKEPFTPEIITLVGAVMAEEGMFTAPDVLRLGMRDKKLQQQVDYEFSDDPEMFSAIYQLESTKTEMVNKFVRERSIQLFEQLRELPLQNGNTKFTQALLQKLRQR